MTWREEQLIVKRIDELEKLIKEQDERIKNLEIEINSFISWIF